MNSMDDTTPTIEEMIRDLTRLGWVSKVNATIWKSPWGEVFRGPYRAWQVATGTESWSSTGTVQ